MYSDYQGHQANDLSPLLVKFSSCTWRIVTHVIARLHPRGSQWGERKLVVNLEQLRALDYHDFAKKKSRDLLP